MIANEADAARVHEITVEESVMLEKSRAPTLRDLHGTVNDLIALLALEPGSGTPEQDQPTK